jgi:hypothetical protein
MSDVRLLHRASDQTAQVIGNAAPRGNSKESITARNELGEFLDSVLIRPLHFNEEQQMNRVEQSLNTMTHAERVYLEIEMTERAKVMHSYDYDALR